VGGSVLPGGSSGASGASLYPSSGSSSSYYLTSQIPQEPIEYIPPEQPHSRYDRLEREHDIEFYQNFEKNKLFFEQNEQNLDKKNNRPKKTKKKDKNIPLTPPSLTFQNPLKSSTFTPSSPAVPGLGRPIQSKSFLRTDPFEISEPLFWDEKRKDEIMFHNLFSVPTLAKTLLQFPPKEIPQQVYLPLFLHYQRDPDTDHELVRVKYNSMMKKREKQQFFLFQAIIPHHFSQFFKNPTLTQTFTSYPSGWEKTTFSSTSIPISLSSDSLLLLKERQLITWNFLLKNTNFCNLFTKTTPFGPVNVNVASISHEIHTKNSLPGHQSRFDGGGLSFGAGEENIDQFEVAQKRATKPTQKSLLREYHHYDNNYTRLFKHNEEFNRYVSTVDQDYKFGSDFDGKDGKDGKNNKNEQILHQKLSKMFPQRSQFPLFNYGSDVPIGLNYLEGRGRIDDLSSLRSDLLPQSSTSSKKIAEKTGTTEKTPKNPSKNPSPRITPVIPPPLSPTRNSFQIYADSHSIMYLPPNLEKLLITDPASCDMLRFDTTITSKVHSKRTMHVDIKYDIMIPPSFNHMITTRSNIGGKIYNAKSVGNDAVMRSRRKMFHFLNELYAKFCNFGGLISKKLSTRISLKSDDDEPINKYNNINNNGSLTAPYRLTVENKTNIDYLQIYNSFDPFLHPSSLVYSFNLNWARYKYLPFIAVPRNLATVWNLGVILGQFFFQLKKIPSLQNPQFSKLFAPFPVTYRGTAEQVNARVGNEFISGGRSASFVLDERYQRNSVKKKKNDDGSDGSDGSDGENLEKLKIVKSGYSSGDTQGRLERSNPSKAAEEYAIRKRRELETQERLTQMIAKDNQRKAEKSEQFEQNFDNFDQIENNFPKNAPNSPEIITTIDPLQQNSPPPPPPPPLPDPTPVSEPTRGYNMYNDWNIIALSQAVAPIYPNATHTPAHSARYYTEAIDLGKKALIVGVCLKGLDWIM
jgi:hypothetical protein